MSTKVERFVRKRNKNALTPVRTERTQRVKKTRSSASLFDDFESETLSSSSPIKPNENSTKKRRRKKIRCTQDFNVLNSSMTSQESDLSVKMQSKKTKKTRGIYNLPKVENISEDLFRKKENISPNIILDSGKKQKKSRKKRTRQSNGNSSEDISGQTDVETAKKLRRLKTRKSEVSNNKNIEFENSTDNTDLAMSSRKRKLKRNEEAADIKEQQTSNSFKMSSSGKDSDIEINIRNKRRLVKKRKSILSTEISDNDVKSNFKENAVEGNYAKRIKQMLLSDEEIKISNPTGNIRNSSKKTELRRQSYNVEHQKMINNVDTRGDTKKRSNSINIIHMTSAEQEKNDVEVIPESRKSVKRISRKIPIRRRLPRNNGSRSGDANVITSPLIHSKEESDRKRKSYVSFNGKETSESVTTVLDNSVDSDDVFYEDDVKRTIRRETFEMEPACPDREPENTSKFRKSLRFVTPEEKFSKNDTFDLENSSTNVSLVKGNEKIDLLTLDGSKSNSSMVNMSSASQKKDGTFEIETPKVLDKSNRQHDKFEVSGISVLQNTSQSLSSIHKPSISELLSPIPKTPTTHERTDQQSFHAKSNVTLHHSDKRDVFGITKCELIDDVSVIDLTTPSSERKLVTSRKFTFSLEDTVENKPDVHEISKVSMILPKQIEKQNITRKDPITPKLNRSTTFTKEDLNGDYIKHLVDLNYGSPLPVANIDTSKVNKRRRWDKSMNNPLFHMAVDIGNTSQPAMLLNGSLLNESLGSSTPNNSRNFIKENKENLRKISMNRSSKIFKCNTPPSGSSTPMRLPKENFLKQALKGKPKVTINDSRDTSKAESKPAVKPLRSKMPNFALIHQRAYDKLENLSEMKQRKETRAKLLMSGQKPGPETSLKLKSPSKSKKLLKFCTEKSKLQLIPPDKKSSPLKSGIISITKVKNLSPSRSNPKVASNIQKLTPVQKKAVLKTVSQIPKIKVPNKVVAERNGFTRFGFKKGIESGKAVSKAEQLKAVATKTNVSKNTVQERRFISQGVRTNRRFDLLMSLRNKK